MPERSGNIAYLRLDRYTLNRGLNTAEERGRVRLQMLRAPKVRFDPSTEIYSPESTVDFAMGGDFIDMREAAIILARRLGVSLKTVDHDHIEDVQNARAAAQEFDL